MRTELAVAAEAAHTRALECRQRSADLADGHRVQAEDVRRAKTALEQAIQRTAAAAQRAAAAQGRLAAARSRRPAASGQRIRKHPLVAPLPDAPAIDLVSLRQRALQVGEQDLYLAYYALGGHSDRVDLDGFIHAVLELPPEEIPVLAQAVWELTEL